MTTDSSDGRFSLPLRLTTSTLLWVVSAVGVATAISFFTVLIYALIYIPRYALVPALALGAIHSLWMQLERENYSSRTDATVFFIVTGALMGLLGFAPTFINFTEVSFRWTSIVVFLLSAAVGGGVAGHLCGNLYFPPPSGNKDRHWGPRLIRGLLVLTPIAVLEIHLFGATVQDRLPARIVRAHEVLNLGAGNATGSQWSGEFQYSGSYSHGSGISGTGGGMMKIAQLDGRITVSNVVSKDLIGGIDANGHFWAGAESSSSMLLRTQLEGQFTDIDNFTYSIRNSVFKDGAFPSHINSTLAKGSGTRWKGWK